MDGGAIFSPNQRKNNTQSFIFKQEAHISTTSQIPMVINDAASHYILKVEQN